MNRNPQISTTGRRLAALPHLMILSLLLNLSLLESAFTLGKEESGEKSASQPRDWAPIFVAPDHCASADISPDERLFVTHCVRRNDSTGSEPQYLETIQLWDLVQHTLLVETVMTKAAAGRRGDGSSPWDGRVWFSLNGHAVIALAGTTIYVLRTQDLKPVRAFSLAAPPSSVSRVLGITREHTPHLLSVEVSPATNRVAVLWTRDFSYGRIDVYDLSTGKHFHSWEIPSGGNMYRMGELAWSPDETMLAMTLPHEVKKPDILLFDVESRVLKTTITSGLVAGSVAFIYGNRILAVERRDRGLVSNRNPRLHVFDIANGTCVRKLSGRGGGIRHFVSSSADGKRFVAYTGRSRSVFNYEGLSFEAHSIDNTFTVWSGKTYEEILTTPDIPHTSMGKEVSLSRRGTYITIRGAVYPTGDGPGYLTHTE